MAPDGKWKFHTGRLHGQLVYKVYRDNFNGKMYINNTVYTKQEAKSMCDRLNTELERRW